MNILIAYADAALAVLHAEWLKTLGDIRIAYSLSEALDRCGILTPDLVLLDLDDTGEDAFVFFHQLLEQNIETPVIVTTREGTLQQAVRAMNAGAADFLVQPIDRERLLLSVQNVLARRATAQLLAGIQTGRHSARTNAGRATCGGQGVSPQPAAERAADAAPVGNAANGLAGWDTHSQIIPLWQVEYLAIRNAIEACDGSIAKAAKLLEVSVSTLYRKAARIEEIDQKGLRLFIRTVRQ